METREKQIGTDELLIQTSVGLENLLIDFQSISFPNRETEKPILERLLKLCCELEEIQMNSNQKLIAEKMLLNFLARIQNTLPANMIVVVKSTLANIAEK